MLREDVTLLVPMPGTYFATVGTKPRSGDSHRVCTVLLPINLVIESYSELLPLLAVMQFGRKCWKGNVFRGKSGTETVQTTGFVEYKIH